MPMLRAFSAASDVPVCRAALLRLGFDIAWPYRARAEVNDVNDVSGLSEPHGPDGAMAERSFSRAKIPQPRAARTIRQVVRTARRGVRADLALLAHLRASGLRHRQRDGRQQGIAGYRRGHLLDAVRLAAALQKRRLAGTTAAVAGGADVRPFRDPAARHGEDAAAGPRRLHHRLAQSARHPARPRPLWP